MIKNTLSVVSLLALISASFSVFAEEPFIGIGMVSHKYKQDFGNISDFEAEPTSYRLTLGSRITKDYTIEAYYLSPAESDDEVLVGATPMEMEYREIVGASINRIFIAGPFSLYLGPNVTAAKVSAESTNPSLDSIFEKETRVSPGLGLGINLKVHKHFSINVNAQTYYYSTDILGTGAGAELRYHL